MMSQTVNILGLKSCRCVSMTRFCCHVSSHRIDFFNQLKTEKSILAHKPYTYRQQSDLATGCTWLTPGMNEYNLSQSQMCLYDTALSVFPVTCRLLHVLPEDHPPWWKPYNACHMPALWGLYIGKPPRLASPFSLSRSVRQVFCLLRQLWCV